MRLFQLSGFVATVLAINLSPNIAYALGSGMQPPPPSCGLVCESPIQIKLTPPAGSVTAGQGFSVPYSIKNVSGKEIDGWVSFNFEGKTAFDPNYPSGLTLKLAPHATITGEVQVNSPTQPGGDLTALARSGVTQCGTGANRLHICMQTYGTATMSISIGANLAILDTLARNPSYDTSDPTWAKKVCNGNTFMSGATPKFEWTPVLDPGQATESHVVALAGQAIAAEDSGADLWFTHPFSASAAASGSGDWDLDVAWSSNPNYDFLVAPALKSDTDTDKRNMLAAATGLANPRSMHIEADNQFIPKPYRASAGDKVVIFGRWIVDCGHDIYQSEIHPPLLFAAARVSQDGASTQSTVIGRPYIVAQTFEGDGLFSYAIKQIGEEAAKSLAPPFPGAAILGDKLHASVAVNDMPFSGLQWMIYYVRPPGPPQSGQQLSVTYHFKVHSGVVVELFDARDGKGTVGVSILFNDLNFKPTTLAKSKTYTVSLDDIKKYDDLDAKLDAALFGAVATGNPPMASLINKGISTQWYGLPPIVEAPDVTVLSSTLAQNTVQVVDDSQPFPITGKVDVHWVTVKPPPLHPLK